MMVRKPGTVPWTLLPAVVLLCLFGSSTTQQTDAPTTLPRKYFYGADQASVFPWESATYLMALSLVAVLIEYLLDQLKRKEGTYTRIVAASVLQETLVVGCVSMFLLGILTVVAVRPLFVLLVRSSSAGLLLMVVVFIGYIGLLTVGLLLGRRSWGTFERTRMAAETLRGPGMANPGPVSRPYDAVGATEVVNRDDDDDDEASANAPSVASMMKKVPSDNNTISVTFKPPEAFHSTRNTPYYSVSGSGSPKSPASPSAFGQRQRLEGGKHDASGSLVHRPLPASALRAPLVIPFGEDPSQDNHGYVRVKFADDADGGQDDGGDIPSMRRMAGFSSREKLFTRCRDLWRETLVRKQLLSRFRVGASAADIRDDDALLFTEYVWRLMPDVMSLLADLGWKAWMVLALIVVIDGVRAVIVVGNNQDVTTSVLITSIVSFVFLGGLLPLLFFIGMMYRLQTGMERFARKPLMRRHEREAKPRMAHSKEELFFGNIGTTVQSFQIVLLVLEWYVAFFYLTFSQPIFQEFGSASILFYFGALLPVILFLWQMPWALTIMAILSGLGEDLEPETIQAMKDHLRIRRGELTDEAKQQLVAYQRDAAGEWNGGGPDGGVELLLNAGASQKKRLADAAASDIKADVGGERQSPPPIAATTIAPSPPPQIPQLIAPWASRTAPVSGSASLAAPGRQLKAPPPAFRTLIPENHLLPGEHAFFTRFADPLKDPVGAFDTSDDDDDDDI